MNGTWDSPIYWTHYQTKATNTASGQIYSAFLGNFFANNTNGAGFGPFYQNPNLLLRFNYNTWILISVGNLLF